MVGTAGFEPATTTPPVLWIGFPYKSMTYENFLARRVFQSTTLVEKGAYLNVCSKCMIYMTKKHYTPPL